MKYRGELVANVGHCLFFFPLEEGAHGNALSFKAGLTTPRGIGLLVGGGTPRQHYFLVQSTFFPLHNFSLDT